MTYRGHVKNGVIVFDEANPSLPEGSAVEISPLPSETGGEHSDEIPTLYEMFEPFIGIADDLPADLSVNHDHYLYGTPKKTL
jgi:hypothetical protein